MLEGQRLWYRYPLQDNWLFKNFSMMIESGEVVGLQGVSGLGKSTLARLLAGYIQPLSGKIRIDGEPLVLNGFCKVQLLFQHPEMAVDPRWKIHRILSEGYDPAQELMHDFEIDPVWLDRYPCELSGGQLSRIALVRALGPNTRYLVADEITTMLDALTQARIWKALLQYSAAHQIGLLVISHDSALLRRLCHRVVDFADMTKGE